VICVAIHKWNKGGGAEARAQVELEGSQVKYIRIKGIKFYLRVHVLYLYIDHVSDTGGSGYILENLDPQTTYDLRFGSKNR
jgi:hypothetical protein